MSEIGRDHFLVATYEHMSLNATPTLFSLPEMTKGKLNVRVIDREGRLEQGISPGPLVYEEMS